MSRINKIKSLINTYNNSALIAKNLLNMAIVKNMSSKNLVKITKLTLGFMIDLTKYYKINWSKKTINIAIGSNQGFCGSFNKNIANNINKSYYICGQRGIKSLQHKSKGAWNEDILKENYGANINCLLNDNTIGNIQTLNLKSLCFKGELENEIDNHLNDYLWNGLSKAFINYNKALSSYIENKYRMVTMKSAKDNTKILIEELSIEYNKLRQQIITNDILLISNCLNIQND